MFKQKTLKTIVVECITMFVWFLAGVCIVYWMLKYINLASNNVYGAALEQQLPLASEKQILSLFNESDSPLSKVVDQQNSNFILKGVVVDRSKNFSAALIAINGQPAQAFKLGQAVADDYMLQQVEKYQAVLAKQNDLKQQITITIAKDEEIARLVDGLRNPADNKQ